MPKLLGRKIGMTRVIQDDGEVSPVTVISVPASIITQVKTEEKDGYQAVVLGFEALARPSKNRKYRVMKEFKLKGAESFEVGATLGVGLLGEVKQVSVCSVSKGHGFTGVIKRWNFSRGPESHGSHHHREPGSSGCRTKPGRIAMGKKFPGRHGNRSVTMHRVPVVKVDSDNSLVAVKGAVAGANGGLVTISW